MASDIAEINLRKSYERTYTMRSVGGGISTSIPKQIVERKAKEEGISPEEFIESFRVVIFFDDYEEVDGAFRFVKKEAD